MSTSRPLGGWPAIRRPRTRWRWRSTSSLTGTRRRRAAERLAQLVAYDDFRIGTGFVGTPLVCDALASEGYLDEAYHLLTQDECPSWLYPVTMGATTIWERWDSMLPDGSINPGEMTSFNHYALGAVADFLHRVVAGLAPVEPGYRTILIRPRPGGGLTSASAKIATTFGDASVSWRRNGTTLEVDVTVPDGASATVDVDGCSTTELGPGTHQPDRNLPSGRRRPRASRAPHTVRRDRVGRSVNVRACQHVRRLRARRHRVLW